MEANVGTTTAGLDKLPDLSSLLYDYQKAAVASNARFGWYCWSRQVGKSFTLTLRRIIRGIARGRNQIFLSAGEVQSTELMAKAASWIRALGLMFDYSDQAYFEGTKFRRLEISVPKLNFRIIGLPANPRTARGWTGDVLLDEFGMHQHDDEIWNAIFPAVSRGQGELDVASTPMGKSNRFYRLKTNQSFKQSTLNIHQAVAMGCPMDVTELHAACDDEDTWRQEYLCEFVDEATAFITYEMIAACEDQLLPRDLDIAALADFKGDLYVGIDLGRKHDLTVIWAFKKIGSALIHRGIIELASMPFRQQFDVISSVLKNKCVHRTCIDSTGLGMQMAEQLQEQFGSYRVEACTFTATMKEKIAGALRVKIEDRAMGLPVCPKIRSDLHSIRRTVTAAGNTRLSAPREGGSHADRFWAAALAVEAAGGDAGPLEAIFGDPSDERGSW